MTPNRTICDVLQELRKLHETRNFSSMLGLIEEAQSMANRMEAKLWDQKDFESAEKRYKNLKKKIKKAEDKLEE